MMQESLQYVENQDRKTVETVEKFEEIEKAVDESKKILALLVESSKKLDEENKLVIQEIDKLSYIAQENAASSEEIAASVNTQTESIGDISVASESLAKVAMLLQEEVSKFKI